MQAWIRKTAGGPAKSIADGQADWKPLDGVRVLAPVAPERNIFCVGKNYREHAREFQQSGFDSSSRDGEHAPPVPVIFTKAPSSRSEEHTSELQSLMRNSYAVFCLTKKKQ